jgi:3-oxoacyl-[acyl-carrier-protein] synthase II
LGEIDATINAAINVTPSKCVEKEVVVALNNTFGFGGHTSTTLYKKIK